MAQKDFSRFIFPSTRGGRWSIALTGLFMVFLLVHTILIITGQRGGHTFLSNPWLAAALMGASSSSVASFLVGTVSIIRYRERSIFVILCAFIGLMVAAGVAGILMDVGG